MKKWLAILVGLIAVAVYVTNVLATPPSGFTPAQQWKGVFGEIDLLVVSKEPKQPGHRVKVKTQGQSDLYVTRNVIEAGGQSGWHTHPGPSLIIVAAGEITAYEGDDPTCTPRRYRAGEGFVDPGDGHVHLLRNETGAPAETVAVQILPEGRVEAGRQAGSRQLRVLREALAEDAVLEMRHAVGLAEPGLFQLDSLREPVEQPPAPAEEDIDQVDPDLVHELGREELLVDVRAHEADPLPGGGLVGPREGALDPVGDEPEHRVRARGRPVGDDEAPD